MCLVVVAVVVWQAPAWLQSFKPRSRAEYQADLAQMRQRNHVRQQRADKARFDKERQYREASQRDRQRNRQIRQEQKQRRLASKHIRRLKRHQRWHDIRRGLGMAPAGEAGPLDRVLMPEPIDWSDPNQRVPYERAVHEVWLAEQLRIADLGRMAAEQDQRKRQERNQRRLERVHRMGLKGIGPIGAVAACPSDIRSGARRPEGTR